MQHNWTQIWRVDSKTKSNNVFILQILSWKVKIRWALILESDQTDVKIKTAFVASTIQPYCQMFREILLAFEPISPTLFTSMKNGSTAIHYGSTFKLFNDSDWERNSVILILRFGQHIRGIADHIYS